MPVSFFSIEFFIFLFFSFLLVYSLSPRFRLNGLVLVSSLFVALFDWYFLLLALSYGLVNFFVGKWVGRKGAWQKTLYVFGQCFNVLVLVFYKLIGVLFDIEHGAPLYQFLILPLGISYYAFQSVSYLFLIYKGLDKPEPNGWKFFLYISFFPKFVAGPIERPKIFLSQLTQSIPFNPAFIVQGGRLFLWGALKKVFIANTLGIVIHKVHGNPADFAGIPTYLAFFLHSSYIYFDFSGYTDMARGLGLCFGVRLSPNFNLPFKAQTVGEFWRRWHISLSSWCNDFIYNPIVLRYRKWNKLAILLGIFVAFSTIGLWHGFSVNFLILGFIQAIAIAYELFTKRYRVQWSRKIYNRGYAIFSVLLVQLVFSVSLIFFFSKDLDGATVFVDQLFDFQIPKDSHFGLNLPRFEFFLVILGAIVFYFMEYSQSPLAMMIRAAFQRYRLMRWSFYFISLGILVFYSKNNIVFNYASF